MNKRLPLLLTLFALILLAASIAYWILQLYKPEQRPLAAAPIASQAEPSPDAAATLFGGQPSVAAISNFQLTGVVAAGPNSAVIIVADGAPPVAVRVGREIAPGVVVQEVHPKYVMLSDGGVMKRVELALDTRSNGGAPGAPPAPPVAGPVGMAPPPGVEPQTSPGVVSAPPTMQSMPPAGGGPRGTPTTPENAQPANDPQDDQQFDPNNQNNPNNPDNPNNPANPTNANNMGGNPNMPPPPNQLQMPPPTRSVNSPVGANPVAQ
ncbi:hypothetical protein B0920_22590 [Massilia sp. KIM]|uniref:hypothetical protein n=1 Tax=Massilia sp. KIM TaxID=1955422 RepID=UPI00098EB08C|nr:hypothetical protein [Massilia sp. KIM]OON60054.1 hypothetical protein B0920_22590 [Massilia sp. KIM]